jgi:SAM-dependent methyltransferase
MKTEAEAVVDRYARRTREGLDARYSLLRPEVWQTLHERQREMLAMFARHGATDLMAMRLTEVGCGSGGNLLELLRMGFAPAHLTGLELLPERHVVARQVLPPSTSVWLCDATEAGIDPGSQDLVLQSTVFSSLLDDGYQQNLAATMWRWLKPGGAIVWYDMAVNNPSNPDVRGVPASRLRALFPQGRIDVRRVTLAPPLARAVCRVHPALYTLFNLLPPLRTHRLAWIAKPE